MSMEKYQFNSLADLVRLVIIPVYLLTVAVCGAVVLTSVMLGLLLQLLVERAARSLRCLFTRA